MGMSASQARLLSITARLSDNENSGQSISYSKQRLADQTEQLNAEYNEALSATKLTVLTGFNGADAQYTDISYNLMTGIQMASNTKQYVVTDTMGRVMVSENIADAYTKSSGDYNKFLQALGYSQADISLEYKNKPADSADENYSKYTAVEEKIHQAWDKYFESVGIDIGDSNEHSPEFSYTLTNDGSGFVGYLQQTNYVQKANLAPDGSIQSYVFDGNGEPVFETTEYEYVPVYEKDANGNSTSVQATDKNGYPIYNAVKLDTPRLITVGEPKYTINDDGQYIALTDNDGKQIVYESTTDGAYLKLQDGVATKVYQPINYDGTTQEQRALYDYAFALTEAYLRSDVDTAYNPADYKNGTDSDNVSALTYYQNLFNKMQSSGFFAYTNNAMKAMDGTGIYKYSKESDKSDTPEKDNTIFENMLKNGELQLQYYSTTEKSFVGTSISDDESIQEVKDESAIAAAETKYTQDLEDLERKDKKLDLELKKLDTEHSALQTEYDSVKNVVDKNVEKTFSIFS